MDQFFQIALNPTCDTSPPFDQKDMDEFLAMVTAALAAAPGLSFVRAVYLISEQMTKAALQEDDRGFVCNRGCGFCCHQLVSCTELEWVEIRGFLVSLEQKRRYHVGKALKKLRGQFMEYIRTHPIKKSDAETSMKVRSHWAGKPCPFLGQEGECVIYPVRPFECRAYYSTEVCTDLLPGHMTIYPFVWQKIASTVLVDEQMKLLPEGAEIPYLPLPFWLDTDELLKI